MTSYNKQLMSDVVKAESHALSVKFQEIITSQSASPLSITAALEALAETAAFVILSAQPIDLESDFIEWVHSKISNYRISSGD